MAQPFYMQYEAEYNGCKNCEDSYQQFLQVYGRMRDPLNGLYYHAYDDSRQMFWCDKVTGLSENFWLRAMGWYAMALIDTMEVMPESMACQKARLNAIYKELIDAMLPYQDQATGMWYQVVNRGGIAPNYLEESGSAIFAYAIMKAYGSITFPRIILNTAKRHLTVYAAHTSPKKTAVSSWAASAWLPGWATRTCGRALLNII